MLLGFLQDVVGNMEAFRDDIVTLYLDKQGEQWVATGNHPNRLIFYQATPLGDMDSHLEAPAYLGALGYLRSLLGSALMRDEPRVELTYTQGFDDRCVHSMKFLARKFEANFECTNPNILNEKDRVRQFPRPNDAIFFPVTKEMRREFDDVARFSTPKADTRLFMLHYDGSYVRAVFGQGKHTSTLILTNEVTGHTEQKIQKLLSLDRFKAMLKLSAEHEGKAAFHNNACWVDFETPVAVHTIVSPTIREQR